MRLSYRKREIRRKWRVGGGIATSAQRLSTGLVRKAPVTRRSAADYIGFKMLSTDLLASE